MKAFTKLVYGGPEVLQLEEVDKPIVQEGHLLIKVKANSANPADWHILRGEPVLARFSFGLFKPKYRILGSDFSGVVEEVGEKVRRFKVGDRVFGEMLTGGAFAEYLVAPERVCAIMPKAASYREMACLPIAGLTALQGLTTYGNVKEGEKVLINGASGGVGHFAVQIAKAKGALVTGVCSSKNVEFVKSLGADRVIAYDQEDIHKHNDCYDLVVDINGNLNHEDFVRVGGRGVVIGFTSMGHMTSVLLKNALSKFSLTQFTAEPNTKDLETLADFIEKGLVQVSIDRIYSYTEIPEAIRYIEAMHTCGKVAMDWTL